MSRRSVGQFIAVVAAASLTFVAHSPTRAADGQMVTVPLDVDVYDKPGGKGKARPDFLPGGSKVELLKENGNHWCNVQGDAVPGGPGWVWCGVGDDGKSYKLTGSDSTPEPTEPTEPTEPAGGEGAGGGGGGQ
jgi:hypothetical protein